MLFSYDRAWQDVMTMFRANWVVLVTLVGAFVFFPAFLMFVLAPLPDVSANGQPTVDLIIAYYQSNAIALLLTNACATFGQAAVYMLLLDRERPTVGQALSLTGALFPAYFIAQILTSLATGAGIFLLIVPGIYLIGRLVTVAPMMVDTRSRHPLQAIISGWNATRGRGWRIAGLVLLIGVVGWVVFSAASSVVTVLVAFVLPVDMRPMAGALGNALSSGGLSLLMVLITAATYRQVPGNS